MRPYAILIRDITVPIHYAFPFITNMNRSQSNWRQLKALMVCLGRKASQEIISFKLYHIFERKLHNSKFEIQRAHLKDAGTQYVDEFNNTFSLSVTFRVCHEWNMYVQERKRNEGHDCTVLVITEILSSVHWKEWISATFFTSQGGWSAARTVL